MAKRAQQQQPRGWYEDPDDGELMRWWTGAEWADRRRSTLVHIAHEQFKLTQQANRNIETIKSILMFYFIASIIGAVLIYVALNDKS